MKQRTGLVLTGIVLCMLSTISAETPKNACKQPVIGNITVKGGLSATPVEASGLIYLPNIAKYFVVSDDTDKKEPVLFVMDDQGRIDQKILIEGIKKINDLESIISYGQHCLYVLTSQSYNREGIQSSPRKLFVRIRQNGNSLVLDKSVSLFDLLLSAAHASDSSSAWADFIKKSELEKSVDIEGMAVNNDTLLLGFKNPKTEEGSVILAIANFDNIFEKKMLLEKQVSIWRTIPLHDSATGTSFEISDLAFKSGELYGLANGFSSKSGSDKKLGVFWKYSPAKGIVQILRSFPGMKPEGLAFKSNSDEYCIVFDNGSTNPSQYTIGKIDR
jgi:hypothetical protein